MELYFLRHAIAVERGDPQYKDDSLRPLTAEGQKKMQRASLGMRTLGLNLDTILSSPYVRAAQTAAIVAETYSLKSAKIILTKNLLPPAPIEKLLGEIKDHFPKSKNILLVGHEPHLTEMISAALKCNQPLDIDFKKGGICSLSIETRQRKNIATLNWLLTPRQLGLMAK